MMKKAYAARKKGYLLLIKMKHIYITDTHNCDGCTACYSICPKNAIEMEPDAFGFLYPQVNLDKCIDCGLCTKACPLINTNDEKNEQVPLCFAARHKRTEELLKSRSGGVFKAIGDYVLRNNGVVYGAAFDEMWYVRHIRVDDPKKLDDLRESKYVQSDMRGVFQKVYSDLQTGRLVCFSGTPCQCAGLYSYIKLKKADVTNLFCVDIVCHGVPSPFLWKDYVSWVHEKYKAEITAINMRDKTIVGWNGHEESFQFSKKKKIYKHSFRVLYYTELITRKSCYRCNFANLTRPSDLTLADFWNWRKVIPGFNKDNKGVSQVLVNTKKGKYLLDNILSDLTLIPTDLQISKQYNMEHSTPEPIERDNAEDFYSANGFKPFIRKYGDWNIYKFLLMQYRRLKLIYQNQKQK